MKKEKLKQVYKITMCTVDWVHTYEISKLVQNIFFAPLWNYTFDLCKNTLVVQIWKQHSMEVWKNVTQFENPYCWLTLNILLNDSKWFLGALWALNNHPQINKDHWICFTFPSTVTVGVFPWSLFGCDFGFSPFPPGFVASDQHCWDLNVLCIIRFTSCFERFEARVFILAWALHCSKPNQNSSTKSYQEQKHWF